MTSPHVHTILKSLKGIKQYYTCGVCLEMCKKPVILKSCFHLICEEHFEKLDKCPTCHTRITENEAFKDDSLEAFIHSAKELDKLFAPLKMNLSTLQSSKSKIDDSATTDVNTRIAKMIKSKAEAKENTKVSTKSNEKISKIENLDVASSSKSETASFVCCPLEVSKAAESLNEGNNPNASLLSVASSSKLNNTFEICHNKHTKISKIENLDVASSSKSETASFVCCPLEVSKAAESLNEGNNPNASLTYVASSSKLNNTFEKRNNKGKTALHLACCLGKVDKVVELLNKGANPNTKDNAGWTPLHEVVQNGRLDLVKLLLQHNTLINVPGPGNDTPLHEAVRYKHKDIVEELVKYGAHLYAINCKGQTPIQLASNDIKKILEEAAENILQTLGANVTYISKHLSEVDFDDIKIHCISQFRTVYNKLKKLCKHHNNMHIEPKFTEKVTHLLVDTEDDGVCLPNLDVLQGIVYGIWILSSHWVTKSTKEKLQPFAEYEVKGVGSPKFNGPKNARYNKYKQLPGLFNGCHFHLHNFNTNYEISETIILNKTILSKLITDADGTILRQVPNPELIPESEKLVPYHAKKGGKLDMCSHYIIFKDMYEPMYNMKHIKALPVSWLIECIEKYELFEPE
ncbi:unnamed protein product [Parnassius apollo]|uniref:(apollo) hypothetical protein n=1 Tax=Parnassius apollo TaxID=110799 RepID=A0A8S3XDM2_PARAO|nr:unnamed protein product [Parnassius apollo]